MKKSFQDQIRDLENTRAAKAARLAEIMQKAVDDGRSLDSAESEDFDTVEGEVRQIDSDLVRLKKLEALNVSSATRIEVEPTSMNQQRAATELRGAPGLVLNRRPDEKFKGQNFTRIIIAKAVARLMDCSPVAVAQKRWGKLDPELVEVVRAAVAGGGTGSGEWGAELVQADARYTGDFIEYLHEQTVFDQLPLREVPAHVVIKGQDGAATGYWVGESKGIPVSKADFSSVTLTPFKVAALAVVSNELLRYSSPSAEQLVRDALVKASAQRVDATFLSATALDAGVSPAGILNGVVAGFSAGTDAADIREDILALYSGFITAKNASDLYIVTTKSLAKSISLMTNALGQVEFPGLTANGGSLLGDPVVTGDNVGDGDFILLKPSDIYKIGDEGVEVSISREATIEQADNPAGATDTPVAMANYPTNMFQEDSTAIKVVRPISFAKRRTSAVAYIGDAEYGGST